MTVKIFILGLPGSGKSAIARYVMTHIRDKRFRDKRWEGIHFNDYRILKAMFRNDTGKQFKPAEHGGFDVLDLNVFDTALKKLEEEVNQYTSSAKPEEIFLIEFSRANYQQAFSLFSREFLQGQDTYFLYLAGELETCKRRIRERTTNPIFEDDYHVSEYIFGEYYCQDDGKCILDILRSEYQIDQQQVRIINNNCSLEEVSTEINAFTHSIIAKVENNEGEREILTCKIERWVDDTHLLPERVLERV